MPYFSKRNNFDFPRNPDGTLILSDKVKKNQVKGKELLGKSDPTFPIDKLIFPKGKLTNKANNRVLSNASTNNNVISPAFKSGGNPNVHQLLRTTEDLRIKAMQAEEQSRTKNIIPVPAKGTKSKSGFM